MFTGTLAMLHRALRLDARLLRTHLMRLGFALLVFFGWIYAVLTAGSVGAPGLILFRTIAYLNVVLISLAGISFFATAITEEKEEETLGLLMLAGINPLGVLLGKSTSRLVGTLLFLFVQMPFILLAITLGGVTLKQVLSAYVSLAAYLTLAANIGLFCSVVCRRGGSASALTLLLLFTCEMSSRIVYALQLGLQNAQVIVSNGRIDLFFNGLNTMCEEWSILGRLGAIMETGYDDSPFGAQVQISAGVSFVLFVVTWLGFRRFTHHPPDTRAPRADFMSRFVGLARKRRIRPGRRALAWKEFHFTAGGYPVQIAKFIIYGVLVFASFWAAERYYSFTLAEAGHFVAWGMLGFLTLEACVYASRVFHDEWRGKTLSILAMLPVRPRSIVNSKILGCTPALIPAVFWLIAGCTVWPDGLSELAWCLILPSRWFYGLVLLLFMTLTAFFSMIVRWGSLPLAGAVMAAGMFFSSCCGSPVIMMISAGTGELGTAEIGFIVVDAIIMLLIFGLQADVRRRVEIASSQ